MFYLEGHATTFWGTETSQTTVDKITETKTSPLDLSLSESPSYARVSGIEVSVSSTSQQNSGLYSAQYTALQSSAVDFHLDLTASIASANGGVACTLHRGLLPPVDKLSILRMRHFPPRANRVSMSSCASSNNSSKTAIAVPATGSNSPSNWIFDTMKGATRQLTHQSLRPYHQRRAARGSLAATDDPGDDS